MSSTRDVGLPETHEIALVFLRIELRRRGVVRVGECHLDSMVVNSSRTAASSHHISTRSTRDDRPAGGEPAVRTRYAHAAREHKRSLCALEHRNPFCPPLPSCVFRNECRATLRWFRMPAQIDGLHQRLRDCVPGSRGGIPPRTAIVERPSLHGIGHALPDRLPARLRIEIGFRDDHSLRERHAGNVSHDD